MNVGRGAMRSEYMHWAKNQPQVRFNLGSSEVAHVPLDRLPLTIADLELDGASRHRYLPLRQAIADRHDVSPDCVVTADGTSMANFLALATSIAPGDEVLVEQPVYEPLLAAIRFLGANVIRFERRADEGFRLDPARVAGAATPNTSLIVITNLHNPSSAFADEAALERIGGLGPRILVDEVYLDSAFASRPRSAFHLGDRFVATSSLTKVYGLSGIRCGWILAEPELAEKMWRLNELFGVAQAHAAERLGCIAFEHLDEIAADTPALLERNRDIARAFFAGRDDLEIALPEAGITLFPRLPGGGVDSLHALLLDRFGTSIVPGKWFEMPEHFRIGLGAPTDLFEEGLARLGTALDDLR